MSQTMILYASVHHQNTKRVVSFLAPRIGASAVDLTVDDHADLSDYGTILVASGIYFGRFHARVLEFLNRAPLRGKRVLLLYTCGIRYRDYASSLRPLLEGKGAWYLGSVGCRGYDTYGWFGKIGGIAKGHPSEKDLLSLQSAVEKRLGKR
jgi:flavodoxin